VAGRLVKGSRITLKGEREVKRGERGEKVRGEK
jgi:hypothetical protein